MNSYGQGGKLNGQIQYTPYGGNFNPGYNPEGLPVGPAFSALPPPPSSTFGKPVEELVVIPPLLYPWANR